MKVIKAGTYPTQPAITVPASFCLYGEFSSVLVNGVYAPKLTMSGITTGNVITLTAGTVGKPTTIFGVELTSFGRVALDTPTDVTNGTKDTTNGILAQTNSVVQHCYIHDGSAKLVALQGDNVKLLNSKLVNGRRYGLKISNGSNVLVHLNEFVGNNIGKLTQPSAYDDDFDAGVSKFTDSSNVVCSSNYLHGNYGTGFWSDGGNINHDFLGNLVVGNDRHGIFYEISESGLIEGNVFRGQGVAGVQVSSSRNVDVTDNLFDLNATGMYFKLADRGPEPEKKPQNVVWSNNHVVHDYSGPSGPTGRAAAFWFEPSTLYSSGQFTVVPNWGFSPEQALTTQGNDFTGNTYAITSSAASAFYGRGASKSLAQWRTDLGFDL